MDAPKRALCIMDISVVGRAGLAAATPVLAACGVQACALPSALFSTHMGGFGTPARSDAAAFCHEALAHYAREDIGFDAVYTGYLCSGAQFDVAEAALRQYPHALKLVDPAMADSGKLYGGLPGDVVDRMARLCALADIITPNFTESALLAGGEPQTLPLPEAAMQARMAHLAQSGCQVVVTSAPAPEGGQQIYGCGPQGSTPYAIPLTLVPQSYPGSGDTFAAALTGLLLGGHTVPEAAQRAASFVEAAARATYEGGGEPRFGLWTEACLPLLHKS